MDNIVTLFEYTSKRFKEGDRDFYDEKNNELILRRETIEVLKKLSEKKDDEKKVIELRWEEIRTLNYVGVIKAGEITIEILPKFLKKGEENELRDINKLREKVAKNLLKMLEYTQELKIREIDYAGLEKVKHDFFEIFIYIFTKNLLSLLKVKQNYEYVRKWEELRFIRGRIDFTRYTNPAKLHIIPCIHYERSMDNLINRTLKYTCYLLSRMTKSLENYRLLRKILDILECVTLTPITIQEIDRITFNRLNIDFKPFIDICRIILERSTLTLQASKIETFSLMIPMEKLFEEFVAEVILRERLHKIFGENAELLIPSRSRFKYYLAEKVYTNGTKKKLFELVPDIAVKVGDEFKLVIDTKYKLLKPESAKLGVSSQDVYQIYAYCKVLGVKKALLLYPDNLVYIKEEELKTPIRLGKDGEVELFVGIVPLHCDLTNDKDFKDCFVKKLKNILESIVGR